MSKEIVFVVNFMNSYGGIERRTGLLSKNLAQHGYAVTVILLKNKKYHYPLSQGVKGLSFNELPPRPIGIRIRSRLYWKIVYRFRIKVAEPFFQKIGVPISKLENTYCYQYFKISSFLTSYLKERPDATVMAFDYGAALSLAIAAKKLPVKAVFCSAISPIMPRMKPEERQFRLKYLSNYHYAVFQTQEVKRYYDSIITGKKTVIHNPVKQDLPLPYEGKRSKRIVSFARLDYQKNFTLLINAFAEIHEAYPEYRLEIYGDGPDEENLRRVISDFGLEESAFLFPVRQDVHNAVLDAAMFVLPSDFEGLSNSMLEAMAIGLPCICTDCDGGGAREIIHDGENGLLVPKGDKVALSQAIERLILHPEFAEKLGRNASGIREELSEEKIIAQWIDFLSSM